MSMARAMSDISESSAARIDLGPASPTILKNRSPITSRSTANWSGPAPKIDRLADVKFLRQQGAGLGVQIGQPRGHSLTESFKDVEAASDSSGTRLPSRA